jgi:predicted porin
MNKTLIALAVAGASLVPPAMAQTANPVTLYGRAYLTFESVEAKHGAISRRNRIEDQSSLLGVRGTEDLGGGLKAFFQLETAFKLDQNDSTFAARNSAVGLQGGFGSILMGRWDMPFKSATIAIDPYGDLTIAGITSVLNDRGNFDRRDQNVGQYWSPNFGGFAFRVAATVNEGKTGDLNPRDLGASVTFTRGPVYVFGAWEEHKDVSLALRKETGMAVGGSMSFGPVKLGAQYQEFEKTSRRDQKAWMGNVVFTFGKNQIMGQYMQSKDGGVNTAAQPECDSISGAYQYNFSRRTFFIASYVEVKNDTSTSECGFGTRAAPFTTAGVRGLDLRGAFLGVRHVF